MARQARSTFYTVCDACSKELPESREERAALSTEYVEEHPHNGSKDTYAHTFDLCFPCADKAFPGWRTRRVR